MSNKLQTPKGMISVGCWNLLLAIVGGIVYGISELSHGEANANYQPNPFVKIIGVLLFLLFWSGVCLIVAGIFRSIIGRSKR